MKSFIFLIVKTMLYKDVYKLKKIKCISSFIFTTLMQQCYDVSSVIFKFRSLKKDICIDSVTKLKMNPSK